MKGHSFSHGQLRAKNYMEAYATANVPPSNTYWKLLMIQPNE